MNHRFSALLLMLFISIATLSCKKEGSKYDTPVKDIEQFFDETGAPVQQFSFSSSANINQTTAAGNTFMISAGSFTKTDGSAVSGNIDIKVRECVSKRDIILSNLTTQSGNKFLTTGGIFYLAAYQNDVALSLSNGKTINFFLNAVFGNGQMLHRYYSSSLPLENNSSDVSWTADADTQMINLLSSSSQSHYAYVMKNTGWQNAAEPVFSNSSRKKITVDTGTDYETSNTAVFVSVDGSNTICKAKSVTLGVWEVENFPVNLHVTVMALAKVNDNYFFSKSSVIVSTDVSIPLVMNSITLPALKTELEQLP
ncbi:MAG TPA: hypothetical protein PLU85_02975 [Bacteroidia bacterium]|nr:hypothetical protein [Bacteroidia bacterium]MBP7713744.1 hypothetical protein [Bacteroidia bacterium]MBP8667952.1 hypothetical protein [Bacteroidia bacterium]HOZ81374.1 hypothetical protein [Bacteroidia bacterium]HOZ89840.1 hypothetical protein [Bacteroidia bacterium]